MLLSIKTQIWRQIETKQKGDSFHSQDYFTMFKTRNLTVFKQEKKLTRLDSAYIEKLNTKTELLFLCELFC